MQKRFWVLYLGFMVLMTIVLSSLPGHNGDMPFYIACMIEKETGEKDPFSATKSVLKNELSPAEYEGHAGRIDRAMPGILDFYRIKPLYIQISVWFHQLGFSYIFSTLLPSLLAYFFIGLITFSWATKILDAIPAIAVSVLLMLTNAAMVLPRLSTPDGLSNLLMLTCFFNIYFDKNKYLTWLLLFISIWLRMDNVVSVLVVLTGLKYWPSSTLNRNRLNYGAYFCLAVLAIGMAAFMNHFLVSDTRWFKNITYIHTLKEYYLQVVLYCHIFSASYFMPLLIFLVVIQYYFPFNRRQSSGYFLVLIASVVFARFLLFPSLENRFMTAYYFTATLLIAERFKHFFAKPKIS
jgi:hypothetical protein